MTSTGGAQSVVLSDLSEAVSAGRAALGDAHQCRAENAVADLVAFLHDLRDGARRHGRVGHFEHRLMAMRVEALAERADPRDAVLLQQPVHLAAGHFDAFDQRLQNLVGFALLRRHGFERALHIVADHEHVAGELGHRISPRVLHVTLGALPEIVHLGREPDQPIGQIGLLRLKPRDLGGGVEGRVWPSRLASFGPGAPTGGRREDRVRLGFKLFRRSGLLFRVVVGHRQIQKKGVSGPISKLRQRKSSRLSPTSGREAA